jgi:hypothetical protein
MHVTFFVTGAYLGTKMETWEGEMKEKINQELVERNRERMPGSK